MEVTDEEKRARARTGPRATCGEENCPSTRP